MFIYTLVIFLFVVGGVRELYKGEWVLAGICFIIAFLIHRGNQKMKRKSI